jgi:hypothetical protein
MMQVDRAAKDQQQDGLADREHAGEAGDVCQVELGDELWNLGAGAECQGEDGEGGDGGGLK